jgi:hypothetical protein
MSLEHTGLIIGREKSAVMLNPKSAWVVQCLCPYGCDPAFYVAARSWVEDIDQATIFRSFDAAQIAIVHARQALTADQCIGQSGSKFDAIPLEGFIK